MRRSQRNTALPLANLETLKEETTVTAGKFPLLYVSLLF